MHRTTLASGDILNNLDIDRNLDYSRKKQGVK